MKIIVFLNGLGLGGTEKAACRWAVGLRQRGHALRVLTLTDGPRRAEFERGGIAARIVGSSVDMITDELASFTPEVIHAHAPGHPHAGDILGAALSRRHRIPVVQTNIFGRLENPQEDRWTDFRLFISWTSCVQAARRSFRPLDEKFFSNASVAVYPLDPDDGPSESEILEFRRSHGIASDEVLFGRLSRPDPNKWTGLPIHAFRLAREKNRNLKLLLREPPAVVATEIRTSADRESFVVLPATADPAELRLTMASLDAVLHSSSIGESFGYGIAEPMNFAKPVIANSTPWQDQAQVELVRPGECGFLASTPSTMAAAILQLASDPRLRARLGANAQRHIRELAAPAVSLDHLEGALVAAAGGRPNSRAPADLAEARRAAAYLDAHQFGVGWRERLALYPLHYRVRFNQWRRAVRAIASSKI